MHGSPYSQLALNLEDEKDDICNQNISVRTASAAVFE
jgi:hypothetical protein